MTAKIKIIVSLTLVVILGALVLFSACAQEQAPTTTAPTQDTRVFNWKYQSNNTIDNPQTVGIQAWADKVEEVSDGRLKIEVYPVGQLVKGVDALDALREKTIEGAETSPGYYSGFMPEGSVLAGFPGIMKNAADMDAIFYDKGAIDLAREAFAEHGAYMLSPWGYGQVPIWGKEPLRTMEDFNGAKIRAYGDMSIMLEEWGAAVTYIPHDESYTALQLGTVDFYSTGLTGWLSMKHHEVCPYIMQPAVVGMGISTNSVSIPAYNELPQDLQMVIDASAEWIGRACTYLTVVGENKILANPGKWNGEVVMMDDEVVKAMSARGVQFLEEYIADGGRAGEIAQIMKDFVQEMGYVE